MNWKSTKLFLALLALCASLAPLVSQAADEPKRSRRPSYLPAQPVARLRSVKAKALPNRAAPFTVRIENISSKDLQMAKDGSRWPFALSPGMWVLHQKEVRLFNEGRAASAALEALAEDGNPGELVKHLDNRQHSQMQHGVFNTPIGASAAAPILPGQAYEFTLTATPGMRLSLVTMFGQSNDWFYAADADGIDLFKNGKPISGEVTERFRLYDAGTEVDEEPGVGKNQAPRQMMANTGDAENAKVRKAKSTAFYTRTGELLRITIVSNED